MTPMHTLIANQHTDTSPVNPGMLDERLASEPFQILELNNILQTTLDTDELLRLFMQGLHSHVEFDGLRYRHPGRQLDILKGKQARNSVAYDLNVNNQSLGEMSFFRIRAFREEDLTILENLLAALFYPLRNSLEYQRVLNQSLTDPLTGANNRAAMDMVLKREVQLAQRVNAPLSILLLDIDHFKKVNDNYGHPSGDLCLQAVAACIEKTIRGSDLLFRCGGEEFLVLVSQTEPPGEQQLAERIRENVEKLSLPTPGHQITVSLGVAGVEKNDSVESLYARADRRLYQAKRNGRNQVVCG
jgi:diguanylate cyclase (GGDEF)-like protein